MEERAAVAPVRRGKRLVTLLACAAVQIDRDRCGHDGAWPLYVLSIAIAKGSNLMEGRAAVASVVFSSLPFNQQRQMRPRRSVALPASSA